MEIDPAWIALIGTIFGGAGLKLIEARLGRNKVRTDDARLIRDELRVEIDTLRKQLMVNREIENQLEREIEEWRSKYYNLRDEHAKVQTELLIALQEIKRNAQQAETLLPTDRLDDDA